MHRRAFFDADCVHYGNGTVPFDGDHCRSVRNARHHGKHQSEAMEKRYGDTKTVVLREFHSVAYRLAVIEYVVMGKHYALRKSGRT